MFYNTSIPVQSPFSGRPQALEGLTAARPFATSAGADTYGGLSQANATDFDRDTQAKEAAYIAQARDMQQQMAMRGLEQMAQQQQNQQQLQTTRMNNATSYLNSLLSGLFN